MSHHHDAKAGHHRKQKPSKLTKAAGFEDASKENFGVGAKGSFTKKTQELKEAKNKQNLRASLTDADPKIDTEKNTFENELAETAAVDDVLASFEQDAKGKEPAPEKKTGGWCCGRP